MHDVLFPRMYRIAYFRRQMTITISGLKTNVLHQLGYAEIAQSATAPVLGSAKC
ncbi:hypothetical protein [Acinetobacter sp. ANC 4640]